MCECTCPKVDPPYEGRFWGSVSSPDDTGCMLWLNTLWPKGYGKFTYTRSGRTVSRMAHRVAYELMVGPVPADLQLDHLCRFKSCVNPTHLQPVTCQENNARKWSTRGPRTECKYGHPWTDDTTYLRTDGYRECRECMRSRGKNRR